MSRGDKVAYGGAPPNFNISCVDNPQYIGEHINNIYEILVDIAGGGYIPSDAEVDDIPESAPPRRLVRFVLDGSISGGTATAYAVEPDGSQTQIASPSFTVHDTLNRYNGASAGKHGWAMVTEYPADTYIYEIVSLGGEGTVTGTANDEKFKISADDTTEGYLKAKAYNNNGSLPGAVAASVAPAAALPSGYQECFIQAIEDSPAINEQFRIVTSTVSATETNTVKASGNDGTPNTLQDKIDSNFRETEDFSNVTYEVGTDVTGDQRVYFHVTTATEGNGGTLGEQVQLYLKRSEDTGTVKTNKNDTLDYLENQFKDTETYDGTVHQLVYSDDTGSPRTDIRLFTMSGACAKITGTVAARSGDDYGVGTAAIGYTSAGTWTETDSSANVYNPSASAVFVPSNLTSIHIPVMKVNDEWILLNPFDPYQLTGIDYDQDQSIGRDANGDPAWQDDGDCNA